MNKKDLQYLAEAYGKLSEEDSKSKESTRQEFLDVAAKLKPDAVYTDSSQKPSPYNYYKVTQKGNGDLGIQKLYQMGYSVVLDYKGVPRMSVEDIKTLEPSDMSVEEFDKLHNAHWAGARKEIMSYKYSH
jgi:hypothetical protein